MTSTLIRDFGKELLASHRISMKRIDDAVRRILRVKFRAGLFENPYAPFEPAEAEAQMLKPDAVAAARSAASRSMVLLQNEGGVLPFDPALKTAVIGPLARNQHDMLGPWWGAGRDADAVTVFDGINEQSPGTTYAAGLQALQHRGAARGSRGLRDRRRLRGGRRGRAAGRPGRPRTRRDPGDERRGKLAQHPRPAGATRGADRRHRGDRHPVRGRALQRPPARAREHRRAGAGDPAGLVPRRAGRARGRGRGLRQGQPGRQAPGELPASGSARCRSTTTTSRRAGRATRT